MSEEALAGSQALSPLRLAVTPWMAQGGVSRCWAGSTFLQGPKAQVKSMCQAKRYISASMYLGSVRLSLRIAPPPGLPAARLARQAGTQARPGRQAGCSCPSYLARVLCARWRLRSRACACLVDGTYAVCMCVVWCQVAGVLLSALVRPLRGRFLRHLLAGRVPREQHARTAAQPLPRLIMPTVLPGAAERAGHLALLPGAVRGHVVLLAQLHPRCPERVQVVHGQAPGIAACPSSPPAGRPARPAGWRGRCIGASGRHLVPLGVPVIRRRWWPARW